MHMWIASSPHLWNPNHGSKILFSICSWLNLRIGNPGIQRAKCIFIFLKIHRLVNTQFKPMFFKVQLYVLHPRFIPIDNTLVQATTTSPVLSQLLPLTQGDPG